MKPKYFLKENKISYLETKDFDNAFQVVALFCKE